MGLLFNGLKANEVAGEVKVAMERYNDRYCLGVILPNGDPWVLWDYESHNMLQVVKNARSFFSSATVRPISIDRHNQLKAEYEQRRLKHEPTIC